METKKIMSATQQLVTQNDWDGHIYYFVFLHCFSKASLASQGIWGICMPNGKIIKSVSTQANPM